MEDRLNNIKTLMTRYETTHPNLINVWKQFLDIRREKFLKALSDCETLIEKIDNGHQDLTREQIVVLYSVYNSVNT